MPVSSIFRQQQNRMDQDRSAKKKRTQEYDRKPVRATRTEIREISLQTAQKNKHLPYRQNIKADENTRIAPTNTEQLFTHLFCQKTVFFVNIHYNG